MTLGPYPEGDPGAMHAAAQHLRNVADQVDGFADRVASSVGNMEYTSTRADTFRAGIVGWRGTMEGVAGELEGLATMIDGEARKLHDKQLAWKRAKARQDAELARERERFGAH